MRLSFWLAGPAGVAHNDFPDVIAAWVSLVAWGRGCRMIEGGRGRRVRPTLTYTYTPLSCVDDVAVVNGQWS